MERREGRMDRWGGGEQQEGWRRGRGPVRSRLAQNKGAMCVAVVAAVYVHRWNSGSFIYDAFLIKPSRRSLMTPAEAPE